MVRVVTRSAFTAGMRASVRMSGGGGLRRLSVRRRSGLGRLSCLGLMLSRSLSRLLLMRLSRLGSSSRFGLMLGGGLLSGLRVGGFRRLTLS